MTDTQVANVLTYIRREWGHGGTAIDPALVTRQRLLSKGGIRPWTDEELTTGKR